MASLEKFTRGAVANQLKHNDRTLKNNSNKDIDPARSDQNYSLFTPEHGNCYDRFKERISELYCYNRKDVKVMASWVVTAPVDLPSNQQKPFFETVHNFLAERYGQPNVIQSVVHGDEAGMPHLHFVFIPATADPKHGGEKVCSNAVLNLNEYKTFHSSLAKYLRAEGFTCTVHSGITREIGNLSVEQLKRLEEYQYDHGYKRGGQW